MRFKIQKEMSPSALSLKMFVVGDRFITEKQILSFVVTFAGVSNYIHYPAHLSVFDISKTSISYSLILFSFYLNILNLIIFFIIFRSLENIINSL